uniref:Uncharacterized protein n=1 Tax=viral metagenome TaxID=1070528 RepID=A0A6C0C8B2_9ZZZZ
MQEICGDLHRRDFECANIGPFKVMLRDLLKFALTRLKHPNIGPFKVVSINL